MLRVGAALCDVRTEQQAVDHEIVDGRAGLTAREPETGYKARRLALDNMVIAGGPPPMLGGGGRKIICACTGGPKSGIAVEFLLEFGIDAVAIEGGLTAWAKAGLPTIGIYDNDDDDDDDDDDDPLESDYDEDFVVSAAKPPSPGEM